MLGILAGYFTHNLVVFDNIISYIFFAIILGLINSRVGVVPKKLSEIKVDQVVITQFAAPVVLVLLVSAIYWFHLPGMRAASDIIVAFRQPDPEARLDAFKQAVGRNSFGHQEITEQLAQQAMGIVRSPQAPEEVKKDFAAFTEEQLQRLEAEKPGDARIEVFIGSYYRSTNQLDKAAEHMALARQYSPNKQAIIIQQGFVALSQGKNEEARDFFQTAFELDENNLEAREYYAASLFYVNQPEQALALMESDDPDEESVILRRFASSDFLVSTANQFKQLAFVTELFEYRAHAETNASQRWSEEPQTWASLAYLYYQQGNNEEAIATLQEAAEKLPTFQPTATCFIENIENGRDPQDGCQ